MVNTEYHDESELIDDELFADFVANSEIFQSVTRNRKYSDIDYIGIDLKGRKCSIELKKRNFEHTRYSTTLIECHKAWKLIERYSQFGLIPLYINFFDDAVLIFDLKKYKPDIDFKYRNMRIYNKGYGEKQNVWRIELSNADAIVFKRNNNNGKYVYE